VPGNRISGISIQNEGKLPASLQDIPGRCISISAKKGSGDSFSFPVQYAPGKIVGICESQALHYGAGLTTAVAGTAIHIVILGSVQLFQAIQKALAQIKIYADSAWDISLGNFFRSSYIKDNSLVV
jgi:hypothetical protein